MKLLPVFYLMLLSALSMPQLQAAARKSRGVKRDREVAASTNVAPVTRVLRSARSSVGVAADDVAAVLPPPGSVPAPAPRRRRAAPAVTPPAESAIELACDQAQSKLTALLQSSEYYLILSSEQEADVAYAVTVLEAVLKDIAENNGCYFSVEKVDQLVRDIESTINSLVFFLPNHETIKALIEQYNQCTSTVIRAVAPSCAIAAPVLAAPAPAPRVTTTNLSSNVVAPTASREVVDALAFAVLAGVDVRAASSAPEAAAASSVVDSSIDQSGWTGLHFAAYANDVEQIERLLVAGGIDIHARDAQSRTPLHIAVQAHSPEAVSALLSMGASRNAVDKNQLFPVRYAVHTKDLEYAVVQKQCLPILRALVKPKEAGVALSQRADVADLLHEAAVHGCRSIIACLLAQGFSPDVYNAAGYAPLHCAAEAGNMKAIAGFTANSYNLGVCTNDGLVPLHIAAKAGHRDVVRQLLSLDPYYMGQDRLGRTPLHFAVLGGHIGVVEAIINLQPVVIRKLLEIKDKEGYTALLLAAKHGNREIIDILVAAGANQAAVANDGFKL